MLKLTINRTGWVEFRTSGNLFGVAGAFWDYGRMPEPHASEYRARREHVTYTVVSYGTPIAWHDNERGWIMPDVKYSTTTSKAQGRIRPGITELQAA